MSVIVEVRDADLDGLRVDVWWSDGAIVRVAPRGEADPVAGAHVVDAGGGGLVPGLHDHHIHLLALAAARCSVRVGPPEVTTRAELSRVLVAAGGDAAHGRVRDGWIRGVGYHESVAGELDAAALDQLVPSVADVAVRIQHRSGQLWVLNTRAVDLVGLAGLHHPGVERTGAGVPTGRIFGLDDWLRARVPPVSPDLAALGRELAAYGVTSVTDLTPTTSTADVELLAHHATDASFPVRVTVTGGPGLDPAAAPRLARGPVKFLPPDHAPPDLASLVDGLRGAHAVGRAAAVHCVSRVGLVVAIAAWREAGAVAGDRIEHGAVIPDELLDEIRELGLTVVTQPNLVAERGDEYLTDVDPDDAPLLWRCGTLVGHGVAVAGGTDAPFGHPDPWRAVAAAVDRTTASGRALGVHERLPPPRALGLFLGSAGAPTTPRRIAAGQRTDLCLLDRSVRAALRSPSSARVRLTVGRAGVLDRERS